jgi:hypothetical protein
MQLVQHLWTVLQAPGPAQRDGQWDRLQQTRQISKTVQPPQKLTTAALQQFQQIPVTKKICTDGMQPGRHRGFRK